MVNRILVLGSAIWHGLCLPEIRGQFAIPSTSRHSVLIVSVTMDTIQQVQSHLLAHQYEGLSRSLSSAARARAGRNARGAPYAMNIILSGPGRGGTQARFWSRAQHGSAVHRDMLRSQGQRHGDGQDCGRRDGPRRAVTDEIVIGLIREKLTDKGNGFT